MRISLLVALLLMAPLAGCLGGDTGGAPATALGTDPLTAWVQVLTDAQGDATQRNTDHADDLVPCVYAPDAPEVPRACAPVQGVDNSGEPVGVVPTLPSRDALGVRMQESTTELTVALDLASKEADHSDVQDDQDGTAYLVVWEEGAVECTTTLIGVGVSDAGGTFFESWMTRACADGAVRENPDDACRGRFCTWHIESGVSAGAPGSLTWHVPRRLLGDPDVGTVLTNVRLAIMSDHMGVGLYGPLSLYGPLVVEGHQAGGRTYDFDRIDPSEQRDYTFVLPTTPVAPRPLPTSWSMPEFASLSGRPEHDLREVQLEELVDRFRFRVALAELREEPGPVHLWIAFGLPGTEGWFGASFLDGDWAAHASYRNATGQPLNPTLEVRVETGSPGAIVFDLHRDGLAPVEPGATIQTFFVIMSETTRSDGASVAGAGFLAEEWRNYDAVIKSTDHLLTPVAKDADAGVTQRFFDAAYDVEAPLDLTTSPRLYDILGAEATSTDPNALQFVLTLPDLSDLRPPDGYDAVLYGIAVRHERGDTMLAHYRSLDRPGGEFLCAPDTTILAAQPADPTLGAWSTIRGRIVAGGSGGGFGEGVSSNAGMIFFADRSCFDLAADEEQLSVLEMRAGTYLMRRPALRTAGSTEVLELDSMTVAQPFNVSYAPAVVQVVPFWSQPFGIENFWDIAGIIVAILTVTVTLAIFYRRRKVFHGYIGEIRRIQDDYRQDPSARAIALVELRRRLHADLEGHRIADSHYPIVLERLRTRLTSARLTSLGHSFYDIPARISLRIERLLDDGYLAESEAEVLVPAIREANMEEGTRDRLLDRLAIWVREDHDEAAT